MLSAFLKQKWQVLSNQLTSMRMELEVTYVNLLFLYKMSFENSQFLVDTHLNKNTPWK